MMGIFYIDTEYTNGNFYLGDIFEIACLSEHSGRIFHSYINIGYKIPNYLKGLCNVEDEEVKSSPSFYDVMRELLNFIKVEERDPPTRIIAHGGYLADFPLLVANCMKKDFTYAWLNNCELVDSVKELQRLGYKKPGLNSFAPPNRIHSAFDDVRLLHRVANDLLPQKLHIYTLEDIIHQMYTKMPISIIDLRRLAGEAESLQHMEALLHELSTENTALNKKQVWKIARHYFRLRT